MFNYCNRKFEIAHGKTPRGRGTWAFETKDGRIWFVDGNYTLTEAKAKMKIILKEHGVEDGTTVYVAP